MDEENEYYSRCVELAKIAVDAFEKYGGFSTEFVAAHNDVSTALSMRPKYFEGSAICWSIDKLMDDVSNDPSRGIWTLTKNSKRYFIKLADFTIHRGGGAAKEPVCDILPSMEDLIVRDAEFRADLIEMLDAARSKGFAQGFEWGRRKKERPKKMGRSTSAGKPEQLNFPLTEVLREVGQ